MRDKISFYRRFYKKVGLGQSFLNRMVKFFRRDRKYDFSLHFTSQAICPQNIQHHNDLTTLVSLAVSGNCYYQALNGIKLGKNCLIAPGVKIVSSNHSKNDRSFTKNDPVIIGDNVWIAANVVILPGIEIADECIVGAGSVVTKSFKEPNKVIAGSPAKDISK